MKIHRLVHICPLRFIAIKRTTIWETILELFLMAIQPTLPLTYPPQKYGLIKDLLNSCFWTLEEGRLTSHNFPGSFLGLAGVHQMFASAMVEIEGWAELGVSEKIPSTIVRCH